VNALRALLLRWAVIACCLNPLFSQHAEIGGHTGFAVIDDDTILGLERTAAWGVWLGVRPSERIGLVAAWAYLPRSSFSENRDGFLLGENQRNRQYVDVTVQIHLTSNSPLELFLLAGGGRLWNNRDVVNPGGFPDFEEAGKESTPKNFWTAGGGFRLPVASRLIWNTELKLDDVTRADRRGIRVQTGLLVRLF
jgi:hypothetical protein